jgi:hypothetical protein
MIRQDNSNVNKTVEKLIDAELKKVGGELLKIGLCHIHVIHIMPLNQVRKRSKTI